MKRYRLIFSLALLAGALAQACQDDGERLLEPAKGGSGGAAPSSSAGDGLGGAARDEGGAPAPAGAAGQAGEAGGGGATSETAKTVLIVLEGLRPELVSQQLTPNIWRIAQSGVRFEQHSSVLPSNRMAAAGSLATGSLPAEHGVLGSRMYLPGAVVHDSAGRLVDTRQPISLEDQGTLESLELDVQGPLLNTLSFVQVAQDAGFHTAVVGRSGPASLFDIDRRGWVLNDDYVSPRAFADALLTLGLGAPNNAQALFPDLLAPSAYVPALTQEAFPADSLIGSFSVPNWTPVTVKRVYANPLLAMASTFEAARELESAAVVTALGSNQTELAVLWMRDPGETALRSGPGSRATEAVMKSVDKAVAQVEQALPEGSNLLIASDGGSSWLAGDAHAFPRWAVSLTSPPKWVELKTPGGLAVDGAVRLTDLLGRAGFLAYDGETCLSGHAFTAYPAFTSDASWPGICKDIGFNTKGGEQTGPALVPETLDPRAIIVASNGASELIYLPSHRASEMAALVDFLKTRPEVGAIFAAERYEELTGTLSLSLLGFPKKAAIDLLLTYAGDPEDAVAYAPVVSVGLRDGRPLNDNCVTSPCRLGLYCDTTCKFCPADVEPESCGLSPSASLEDARLASQYASELGYCETSQTCAKGLECVFEQCRKPGDRPVPTRPAPPDGYVRGSEYGVMSGIVAVPSPFGTGERLVRDNHGVRGGGSPADLRALLIAKGPAFKQGVVITTPSSITDVAATILHVMRPGLEEGLSTRRGRVLVEGLLESDVAAPTAKPFEERSLKWLGPVYSPTKLSNSEASLLDEESSFVSVLRGFGPRQADGAYKYLIEAGTKRSSLLCDSPHDCPDGVGCSSTGMCAATPDCSDGLKNGLETDVDCGFAARCLLCSLGQACSFDRDCHSQACGPSHECVDSLAP